MVKVFKGSRADIDLNNYYSSQGYKIVQIIKAEHSFWEDHIITVLLEKIKTV